MSLVTSTPPSSHLENATDSRAKTARVAFKNSPWRPIVCCAGALGIGLSLAPVLLRPQNIGSNEETPPEIVLASESTLVVTPTLPPGALLRGQIELVADVTGKARVSGQVARHLVESGARVERGDAVLEISSGEGTRAVPLSEGRQNRAEQGQIAAADAQTSLSQKMAAAQTKLSAAQERVAASQTQVTAARDIVRRLQNGKSVAPSEIPAPFRGSASNNFASIGNQSSGNEPRATAPNNRRTRRNRRRLRTVAEPAESRLKAEGRIASRQAQAAQDAAKSSARDLQTAQKMLGEALVNARVADEKLQIASKGVAEMELRFSAKKATGADVESARAVQKEAQQAVNIADKALLSSKAEVTKREKSAATSQIYAKSAEAEAARAASVESTPADSTAADNTAKSAANSASNDDKAERANADDTAGGTASGPAADAGDDSGSDTREKSAVLGGASGRVTLDQAIQFASAALDESRRASRVAERLHTQIESYQGQVTNSQTRVQAATQDLVSAQQKVLDSVPRPRFTTSYAPASGVVMWIARLAREVGAGQSVFGVARGRKVAARFEDKSGLWRGIKKDAVLSALVVNGAQLPESKPKKNSSESSANSPEALYSSPAPTGYPVNVKITEIESPSEAGAAAILTAEVKSPDVSSIELRAGSKVLVSMPRPNQKASLSVPLSALVQRGKTTYLALLAPVEKTLAKGAKTDVTSGEEMGSGPIFRLQWRRVQTGRSDGLRLEITAGLKAGDRVVGETEQLESMGFAPEDEVLSAPIVKQDSPLSEIGGSPTFTDTQNATSEPKSVSDGSQLQPMPQERAEVLVRLTPALT